MKLEEIGLTVSRASLPGDNTFKEIEDVLKPLSIILNFQRLDSKAQASADLPKYKFNAKMADVHVKISNYRIMQVLYTINSIKNKWISISTPNRLESKYIQSLRYCKKIAELIYFKNH